MKSTIVIELDENNEVIYSIEGDVGKPTIIKMLTTIINKEVDELEDYDEEIDFDGLLRDE